MAVGISAEQLEGAWSLRFGVFGCRDSETRGGIAQVGAGRLSGRDALFAYEAQWTLRGTELRASLDIVRHGTDAGGATVFGAEAPHHRAECTAEVITADLIEGRIVRPGSSDIRLAMRRLNGRSGC